MVDNKLICIHEKWHSILGKSIPVIEPYQYVKLSEIIESPRLPDSQTIIAVLPYIRQKVKMWGADILKAENIKTWIGEEDDSDEESHLMNEEESSLLKKNRLSRFDCIASLFASAECTVGQDIFRTLSQFPIAFPLIIPNLEEANKFKVMIPLFTGPVIKWETTPGTIIENHLFNDPFKLIVAVRIGTNSQGKSTILNQLMTSDSMFSSRSEPRAEYGIPHMINGSVEFTWLTQETCRVSLWNDVFEGYYKKEANKEIVLLANLHGDALEYPDQIKFLMQFPSSSFIVFLMPGYTQNQIKDFEKLVGPRKVVFGYVNHRNSKDKKKYTIDTNYLMQDKTLKKVRMMFKEAIDISMVDIVDEIKLGESLQMTEDIEILKSQNLIDFVKSKKCRHIKLNVFQLQRKQHLEDGLQIWQNNNELQEFTRTYTEILKLPLCERRRALAHLEREISKISMIESAEARNQAMLKKDELRKSSLSNRGQENEKKIREEIAKIWKEVDNMSLGLEHFFRELGQIYKIFSVNHPDDEIVTKLPELYSELLIGGQTIELLDGDAGSISEAWFSAICGHICKKYPKLRIFVISILGLQSSGKSTLLNALFACKFAVSVGRCTRGLFMRLLFLDKDLSEKLNVDAFILIDTEGLGAPEKMDDPESEKKDRTLATFAMGVSNLTILNVLGESMRDLTEILQIAIVTMARLEKAGMAPDILMVQHISERNKSRLSEPEEKFRVALKDALKIAEEKDIEMGISNIDCLQILDERIGKGQLLKQFRPFKNGATAYAPPSEQYHEDVVNLYNSIIEDCKNSKSKIEFSEWHSLIQNYWNAVSHEDFAVRFKNIKEIYEFIDLGNRIAILKETIDRSFQKHEELIKQEIRSSLQDWSPNDTSDKTDKIQNKCLDLIKKELKEVPGCNNQSCEECKKTNKENRDLEEYLKNKNNEKCEMETKQTIRKYTILNRSRISAGLEQILNASIIRKGISSESLDIINKNLENILKRMPKGRFSDYERKQKVEQIWIKLRNYIFSRNDNTPIAKEIDQEVEEEYYSYSGLYNSYKTNAQPDLSRQKAYRIKDMINVNTTNMRNKIDIINVNVRVSQFMELNELKDLQYKLDNLIDIIFKERTAYNFYHGIVRDLKKEINKIISPSNFLPEFKWEIHLYALLKFRPKMIKYQEEWDKENTPLGMLDQKKDEYLKIIDTRLQYGHRLISEGHIAGDYLLRVIHKKAMEAGNDIRIEEVRGLSWMSNAETIRLKYFGELASQVQSGNKDEAIKYFLHPKCSIEAWFESQVDGHPSRKPREKYEETFNAEFKRVFQDIRNCQNFEEIKNFINDYMIKVDYIDYKLGLDGNKITESDLKILRENIENELKTKGSPRDEPFQNPSNNKSVMGRIGCTESCFWCGALCWGNRDHHIDSNSTKVHHTSHQPRGLSLVCDRNSKELRANSCHKTGDDWDVWFKGKGPIKWGVAKINDFSDWKFEAHCNHHFDELMCWFFEKLHVDLAKHREDAKPASCGQLGEYKCVGLDYYGIMSTLREKIK
ncbi:interferon-induced very large GTPase 1-like [Rhizophagus clarus]|uniref:Interferon-induced very large GTPase 1-like n=2 Tax=Rhizophagus clarus TaxID=94130 RepID=A0A8H3QAL9_9GLOM|nr:interferon-induced very large GTPase 1-like [Rhizophagus clarus]